MNWIKSLEMAVLRQNMALRGLTTHDSKHDQYENRKSNKLPYLT